MRTKTTGRAIWVACWAILCWAVAAAGVGCGARDGVRFAHGTGGGVDVDGGHDAAPDAVADSPHDAPADAPALQPGDPCDDAGGRYDQGGACCHSPCLSANTGWLCGACEDAGKDAGPACAHDPCTAGVMLDPACDPCVAVVCKTNTYCCDTAWNISCMSDQGKLCGIDCQKSAACAHNPCAVGGPLDGGHETACSLPVYQVCHVGEGDMPECCDTAWTSACVAEVQKFQQGCP